MHRSPLLLCCLLLLSLILGACKGDNGTIPMALSIDNISQSPAGPQEEGTVVVFTATVTSTTQLTSIVWSFPPGSVTINQGAGTLIITATFDTPGQYQGSLTVNNAGNDGPVTAPFNFEVDPAIPVVTGVTPAGNVGLPLGEVEFEAEIDGTAEELEWDFGGGAEIISQTGNRVLVRLLEPLTYEGRVTATNGNGSSTPFLFSYQVAIPTAPNWQITDLGQGSYIVGVGGLVVQVPSIKMNGTLPAVVFNGPDGVMIARATTAAPAGFADWAQSLVAPGGFFPSLNAFAVHGGRYYVLYFKQVAGGYYRELWLARSTTATPAGPGDWVHYLVGETSGARMVALGSHPEGLALGYVVPSGPTGVMRFGWTASPESTTTFEEWEPYEFGEDINGVLQLELLGSHFYALLWSGDHLFTVARATAIPPSSASEWAPSEVGSKSAQWYPGSLQLVGHRLMLFRSFYGLGPIAHLVHMTTDLEVDSGTAWTTGRPALPSGTNVFGISSTMAGGRLAVATAFEQRIQVYRQTDASFDPDSATGWETTTADPGYLAVVSTVAVLADGRLILAYSGGGDDHIRVSVADGPF
ncbi:MAG TPA: hypothetical protein VEI97_14210 [bacterium]|nr:hypothetical protein [bacterium]